MARGKNATALFEVIHTSKKPPKASPSGGGIPAPKWWAKGSKSAGSDPTRAAAEPSDDHGPAPAAEPTSGGTRRSWLAAARRAAEVPAPAGEADADHSTDPELLPHAPAGIVITKVYPLGTPETPVGDDVGYDGETEYPSVPDAADEPAAGAAVELPPEKPSWAARRAKAVAERSASPDAAFDPTADVTPSDLRGGRSGRRAEPAPEMDIEPPPAVRKPRRSAGPTPSAMKPDVDPPVALDRSAGEVRFRLSYAGAITAGIILLLVLVIAYLAGQHSTTESAADVGGAGHATVARATDREGRPANTSPATSMMAAVSPVPLSTPAATVAAPTVTAPAVSVVAPPAATPAPPLDVPVIRQPGVFYVVVQAYPDRETADRAAAFMNRNNVPCDVVAGPSGFAMRDWSSVVTRQSFPREGHEPALGNFIRAITQLGPKFDNKTYNQFLPQPYLWRADSDVARP